MDKEILIAKLKKIAMSAVEDAVVEVVVPALEEYIASSENKYDDMLLALKSPLMSMIDKIDGVKDL